MQHDIANPVLLRRVLGADVLLTGATALAMAVAAGPLAELTALPAGLLRGVGLALLPYVAWVAWLLRRPSRRAAWAVNLINGLYAADCVLLLASGWVSPNVLGVGFVLVQAVTVATLAVLGHRALGNRRTAARLASA